MFSRMCSVYGNPSFSSKPAPHKNQTKKNHSNQLIFKHKKLKNRDLNFKTTVFFTILNFILNS